MRVDRKKDLKCQPSHLDIQIWIGASALRQSAGDKNRSKSLRRIKAYLYMGETENGKYAIEFNWRLIFGAGISGRGGTFLRELNISRHISKDGYLPSINLDSKRRQIFACAESKCNVSGINDFCVHSYASLDSRKCSYLRGKKCNLGEKRRPHNIFSTFFI